MSVFEDQAHFMRSCDQSVTQYNPQQAALYLKLVDEEYNELLNAKFEAEAADAVIDMMVVLIGYGLARGIDATVSPSIEDVKKQELVAEYRRQASRLRNEGRLRRYVAAE